MNDRSEATSTARVALLTGVAGFVGSHLCERLLADGWQVIGLDDLSTGNLENLRPCRDDPSFRFVRHDITQPLPAVAAEATHIFNLACPASPRQYQRTPVATTLTSVLGVTHLLQLAERTGACVLQASSSEIYGDPHEHPQQESYRGNVNPIGPRACYDEGKRCAETLCFAYHLERDVPIRIARIFNTYGPRLAPGDGRVVSNFIAQALHGDALTVYGDGHQTRSFCYVDDTVEALVRLIDAEVEGPLNIGNPVEHTVLELAQHVLRLTGSRSRIEYRPLPADDPHRRCPAIARAARHLGWQPKVKLDDGLRLTIEFMRQAHVTT